MSHAITNATIVLADEILTHTALIIDDDGLIAAIDPTDTAGCETSTDAGGKTLLPGLIDLHCDAIEKAYEPRPGAAFPIGVAIDTIDRINAAAGITTPFHAIAFGMESRADPQALVDGIRTLQQRSLVDHRLHCRYEIASEESLYEIEDLIKDGIATLVSVMDHSPGQGQFRSIESFVNYYTKNHGITREEAVAFGEAKQSQRQAGHKRALELCAMASEHGVKVASHDDDSLDRVIAVQETGATISEFPINLETTTAAHERGMHTILGAPNILRGGSQSGNMRALDAVLAGACDCLCADYAPAAMLPAALKLPAISDLSLPEAIAMVSLNPAKAADITDRGQLKVGLRADIILADCERETPCIESVWCEGRLIQHATYSAREVSLV